MTGRVFSVQPFCVDDGPGIRTTVYLKGCNMRCPWCHNPEGISPLIEVSYIESRCENCGRCAAVCEAHTSKNGRHAFDRDRCSCGGRDVAVCPSGALAAVGADLEAIDVIREVARDRRFFDRSGGGMTVTGGEPTMQPEFLRELLALAKAEDIHSCIETNGAGAREDYRAILGLTDLFLVDYKLTDEAQHAAVTGMPSAVVLENIAFLCDSGADVVLRCPVIPGVNDVEDHFRAIAELTKRLPVGGFEIMPYHPLGSSKARRLGKDGPSPYRAPDRETVERWRAEILSMGGREWGRGL
ncbi:MAG: glycyl-radical enzyme activating protein [Clostridiales bacterium]|nr:glycyl-radical enzyme activating protein [Clostridiales bacterium]OPZ68327.1 MAG: Benzylsuccinate synthase activating enzyme [Firmicutes bacterium ADurb.Bin467]